MSTAPGRDLRVAILGGGMVGQIHRRSAIAAGAEVIGVLGSAPDKSRRLADDWGVPLGFASIEQVCDSAADVVHVCTPNATHLPYTLAALAAGKHVICEKPLGLTVAEAEQMTRAADAAGLIGAVPFTYRYQPLAHEIRARHLAGEFGAWNLIHGSYLQDWLLSPSSTNWRVDPVANGRSRAFADIGSHWCDLMEWISGERIAQLTATFSIALPERYETAAPAFSGLTGSGPLRPVTTEDSAIVSFKTANGVVGSVTISQVAAGHKNRLWLELDGAEASAIFDGESPEKVWLGRPEGASILFRDPLVGSPDQRRLSIMPAGHAQGFAQGFDLFVADAYTAIRGEEPAGLPRFADGLRSMRIVDAAVAAAASQNWTTVVSANDDAR